MVVDMAAEAMHPLPVRPLRVSGQGIVLRAFNDSDLPRLREAFADVDIRQWNPVPHRTEEIVAWRDHRNDWSAGDHASWAIGAIDGQLLGSVSLHHIDWNQRQFEVGYWVAPWGRRQRVGVSAVVAAIEYAFTTWTMHRAYLYHSVHNFPSCALALSAGMRQEGTLLQSFRYADGTYHDEHLHARLASE